MAKHRKPAKTSHRLSRFDPSARKGVADSELITLEKVKNADFFFLKGEKHRIGGELEDAISCYGKALDAEPEHQGSLFFMGYCYLLRMKEDTDANLETSRVSKLKEAVSAFEKLIAVREEKGNICWDDYTVYYYLGTAQFGLGLYEEAIKSFCRAIDLNSRYAASYYMLGLARCRRGCYNEAVTAFKHAVRMKPDFGEAHGGLAHAYHESGRHEEAIAAYKEAIKIKPREADLHFYLGLSFALLGRHEEAITSYKEAIKLEPALAEAHSNLGVAYYALGRYEEAIASYREATRVKPDSVEAHCRLGSACSALGRHEEAIASYKEAIRTRPDFAEVHSNLGLDYYALGRYEEAIASCKEAIELRPDLAEAHSGLARAYHESGRHEEAIAAYKKAIKIKPREAHLHFYLGLSFTLLGRHEEAIASYREAIKLEPALAEVHYNLGVAYYALRRDEEALASYREAVRIRPDFAEVHSNLGAVYYALRRYEEALASCREAVRIRPDFAEVHSNLGAVYCALGRHEEAIASYKEAVRIRPDLEKAYFGLGDVYDALCRHEEAIASYTEAIRIKPDFVEAHFFLGACYSDMAEYNEAIRMASRAIELATRNEESMIVAAHAAALRGAIHGKMSMYSEARSDYHLAICFARRANCATDIIEHFQGIYYWVSGIESHLKNRYEKARVDLQSALVVLRKGGDQSAIRSVEFLLESIDVDDEIVKLASVKNIESLRSVAEDILARMEHWKRTFDTTTGGIPKEAPPELWNSILAKYNIVRLLADVLSGKPLNDLDFIDASETLESLLHGEWSRRFESIGVLLRKLARYKDFEEMKKAEQDILGLTPDLSVIDGCITGQVLKHASWPLEMMRLLKQQVEQTQELRSELISREQPVRALKPTTEPTKITFTNAGIIAEGKDKPLRKTWPLRIAEYLILKSGDKVHYLWAYVILPTFNPIRKGPEWQFTNYISKAKGVLAKRGIHVATYKGERGDWFGLCEPMDDSVVSNARDIVRLYKDARCHYEDGNMAEAIEILSKVSNDAGNNWYAFTDAWMDLAKWIGEQNFAGVSDDLILRCREFLTGYLRRLRIGISRIELYMKHMDVGRKCSLSEESMAELAAIKAECKDAEALHDSFLPLKPLAPEEHAYERLVQDLQVLHDGLQWIEKPEEEVSDYGHIVGDTVQRLCKRNKTLAEIVEYGRASIDQMLGQSGQRRRYSEREIRDMREEVPFILGDVIAGIDSFDEFDRNKGDKLEYLKRALCHRLGQRLAQRFSSQQR